jgi:hypothetical protein
MTPGRSRPRDCGALLEPLAAGPLLLNEEAVDLLFMVGRAHGPLAAAVPSRSVRT